MDSAAAPRKPCPAWAQRLFDISEYLVFDFAGGPPLVGIASDLRATALLKH
jgi:hypothetical protein